LTTPTRTGKGALVICSTCGKSNADHLVFCEDCGARLAPRIAPPTPPIGVTPPPSALRPAAPAAPSDGLTCTRCGATSAAGMRFCITCGSPLQKPSAPAPAASPIAPVAAPAAPVPAASPIAPAAPIAPAPVVGFSQQPQTETRTCKRCQGTSDKNAQFCRFCGAPLADGVPSRPPAPSDAAATRPSQPRLDATLVTSEPIMAPSPEEASTPAARPHGRLVVIEKDGGEGRSFPLADQTDIGREAGACVFADDRYMSPRHARITRKDGELRVRDLGTTNGVYLRLRKGESGVPLEDQDLILLGQQVLRFEIVKDAEAGFGAASELGTLVFGTPAAPRYARLSQRTTEGVSCDVFHVRKPETVLGRESGDVVFPDDPFLSRRHASVRASDGPARTYELVDLGSSNGTFVRIRGEVVLANGDEIRVGQQLLRVDLSG
jgi:pSer/pThr/pTyr-binding forkhead associated (FHA) protein